MVGATGFEPATFRSRTGRSTRLSHAPTRASTGSVLLGHSVPRSRTECSRPQILEFQVLRVPGGNWGSNRDGGLGVVPARASVLLHTGYIDSTSEHLHIRARRFSSSFWPSTDLEPELCSRVFVFRLTSFEPGAGPACA